jgi:hypothetical protein
MAACDNDGVFEELVRIDKLWAAVERVLVLDALAAASLSWQSLWGRGSAMSLILYHAVMDAFVVFYLFARHFTERKRVEECELYHLLREPPLSYAPSLMATVPFSLFAGHLFLVFGGAPSNEWLGLLAGYVVAMLGIIAAAYLVFYRLDLE